MNNVKILMSGPKAEVWCFARNGQAQVLDFLKSIPDKLVDRFRSQWERLAHEGLPAIIDRHRLAPLQPPGKGLWAFKQFDARIYATFVPNGPDGRRRLVLLSGWTKDKTSSIEEDRQIIRAQRLRAACLSLAWPSMAAAPVDLEAVAAPAAPVVPAAPEPAPEITLPERTDVADVAVPRDSDRAFTITDLAALSDVPYSTLRGWIRQGKLPAPSVPAAKRGTFGWVWSDADALFTKAVELRGLFCSRRPSAVAAPMEGTPTPHEPLAPTAVPVPQEPEPILSRDDLVALAARVIDGDGEGDAFLRLVRRRLDRIGELETVRRELSRLLGKDVS
ncbi:MAG: hypothetical protein ABID40_03110 [Candidatus Bipolaricaulota bacterium]